MGRHLPCVRTCMRWAAAVSVGVSVGGRGCSSWGSPWRPPPSWKGAADPGGREAPRANGEGGRAECCSSLVASACESSCIKLQSPIVKKADVRKACGSGRLGKVGRAPSPGNTRKRNNTLPSRRAHYTVIHRSMTTRKHAACATECARSTQHGNGLPAGSVTLLSTRYHINQTDEIDHNLECEHIRHGAIHTVPRVKAE